MWPKFQVDDWKESEWSDALICTCHTQSAEGQRRRQGCRGEEQGGRPVGGLQEGDEAEARVQTRLELGRAREKAEETKDEKEEESPSDPSKMKITRVFDFAGENVE